MRPVRKQCRSAGFPCEANVRPCGCWRLSSRQSPTVQGEISPNNSRIEPMNRLLGRGWVDTFALRMCLPARAGTRGVATPKAREGNRRPYAALGVGVLAARELPPRLTLRAVGGSCFQGPQPVFRLAAAAVPPDGRGADGLLRLATHCARCSPASAPGPATLRHGD